MFDSRIKQCIIKVFTKKKNSNGILELVHLHALMNEFYIPETHVPFNLNLR